MVYYKVMVNLSFEYLKWLFVINILYLTSVKIRIKIKIIMKLPFTTGYVSLHFTTIYSTNRATQPPPLKIG